MYNYLDMSRVFIISPHNYSLWMAYVAIEKTTILCVCVTITYYVNIYGSVTLCNISFIVIVTPRIDVK